MVASQHILVFSKNSLKIPAWEIKFKCCVRGLEVPYIRARKQYEGVPLMALGLGHYCSGSLGPKGKHGKCSRKEENCEERTRKGTSEVNSISAMGFPILSNILILASKTLWQLPRQCHVTVLSPTHTLQPNFVSFLDFTPGALLLYVPFAWGLFGQLLLYFRPQLIALQCRMISGEQPVQSCRHHHTFCSPTITFPFLLSVFSPITCPNGPQPPPASWDMSTPIRGLGCLVPQYVPPPGMHSLLE